MAAPTPPPQTTVEQSIETELDKPENSLLRQWLNYQLGSPGEKDPITGKVNVPEIAPAPGEDGGAFVEYLDELGLTNVKVKVLSNPDFDPAYDEGAVVRISPPPGTSIDPSEEVEVTINRTAWRSNDGSCDTAPRILEGPPPSGDPFEVVSTFSGRNPLQAMAPTDVRFRWGTETRGYRKVATVHGWNWAKDPAHVQLALDDRLRSLTCLAHSSSTSSTGDRTKFRVRAGSSLGSTS